MIFGQKMEIALGIFFQREPLRRISIRDFLGHFPRGLSVRKTKE
jgi:hypothetical protein